MKKVNKDLRQDILKVLYEVLQECSWAYDDGPNTPAWEVIDRVSRRKLAEYGFDEDGDFK